MIGPIVNNTVIEIQLDKPSYSSKDLKI